MRTETLRAPGKGLVVDRDSARSFPRSPSDVRTLGGQRPRLGGRE